MAEQRSKIKGCGKHIDQDIDIETATTLPTCHAPLESGADRTPARHQHVFPNHSREDRIERHVGDESRNRFSQWSAKGSQQRSHRGLKILAQGARVGRRLGPQLGNNRIRNQMTFAWPTPIEARTGALYLTRDSLDCHSPITAQAQAFEYRGDDLSIDTLIFWPAPASSTPWGRLELRSPSRSGRYCSPRPTGHGL